MVHWYKWEQLIRWFLSY